ncbi:MAG: helix-turn-helix domain-containing protein [Bacilli bacterium]|jgi:transposase-like protein
MRYYPRHKKKNVMRTPGEKEEIINEYLDGSVGLRFVCTNYEISYSTLRKWVNTYQEKGIEGLKSNTGKSNSSSKGRPKKASSKEEELERIIIKQQIEIERLKKGYYVKGVGQRKEYISTYKRNTK